MHVHVRMHVRMYACMHMYISVYTYIHSYFMYMYICMCVHIYIYKHKEGEGERAREREKETSVCVECSRNPTRIFKILFRERLVLKLRNAKESQIPLKVIEVSCSSWRDLLYLGSL